MVLLRYYTTTYYSDIVWYIAKIFHSPEVLNFPYSAGKRIIGIGDTIEKNLDGQ
jgi:hypothetical protein